MKEDSALTSIIPKLASFLICALVMSPAFGDSFNDCILENMKGVQDRLAALEIRNACLEKTTPKKCRELLPHKNPQTGVFDFSLEHCLEQCQEASLWARYVGECRI
jgi:hypothetical protein